MCCPIWSAIAKAAGLLPWKLTGVAVIINLLLRKVVQRFHLYLCFLTHTTANHVFTKDPDSWLWLTAIHPQGCMH